MKKPKIRFKGFNDDWEQRKFAEIAVRESVARVSSSDIPSVEYEDVVAEEGRLNKDIILKDTKKSGIVFDGSQVLYGKLRPYLHNWLNPDFKGVAVGDWWVLRPIETDKNFLYRLIQTQQFDDIANQSSGSKMPRADWNLISNTIFMIPSSKEEQHKIGEYFNSIDSLITLHQRKCDEIKELKKYMLQNMFPQNDEKAPKIRFNGFTDDWEQRKFKEGIQKYQNTIYLEDDVAYNQVSIRNNGTVEYRDTKLGINIGRKRQYLIDTNSHPTTLTFTRQTIYEGGIGFVPKSLNGCIVTENMPLLDVDTDVFDPEFMKQLFKTFSYYILVIEKNKPTGSAQKAMHENTWLECSLLYPNIQEQREIGKFFIHLDNLITLHQRKCDELKNMKKFMLQNMFV